MPQSTAHVELRPDPTTSPGNPRWVLLVNGQDISDAVAHDGFHVDFDHGRPRVVLTLRADVHVDLDLIDADTKVRTGGPDRGSHPS